RHEFLNAERLGYEVVRAGVERRDLARFLVVGGKHKDRRTVRRGQRRYEFTAVAVRQIEIKDDNVGLVRGERAPGGGQVMRLLDGEILGDKDGADKAADRLFIIDDQRPNGNSGWRSGIGRRHRRYPE